MACGKGGSAAIRRSRPERHAEQQFCRYQSCGSKLSFFFQRRTQDRRARCAAANRNNIINAGRKTSTWLRAWNQTLAFRQAQADIKASRACSPDGTELVLPPRRPIKISPARPLQNLKQTAAAILLSLSGAVGFVLLITCANVASLSLSLTTRRGVRSSRVIPRRRAGSLSLDATTF